MNNLIKNILLKSLIFFFDKIIKRIILIKNNELINRTK